MLDLLSKQIKSHQINMLKFLIELRYLHCNLVLLRQYRERGIPHIIRLQFRIKLENNDTEMVVYMNWRTLGSHMVLTNQILMVLVKSRMSSMWQEFFLCPTLNI